MTSQYKLKLFVSRKMDGVEDGDSVAMHRENVEDMDFRGLPDDGRPGEELCDSLLSDMTLEEKIRFAGGYKKLGIHPLERLGLPSIWCSDASAGMRCFPGGTAFPAPVLMAATWNRSLIRKIGSHIGEEFRHKGISVLLGPGVNIYRVPTNGRNFEYMGEDPYLAGKMASSYIQGAQESGVITTVKHFACNNSEYDRHKLSSNVDERTLREIYLLPFEMAVKEGKTLAVMSSYNPVNGVWASENRRLLTEILREEWGFEGFVISDWNSLYSTAGALKSGLNLEMPSGKWLSEKKIKGLIRKGIVSEEELDLFIRPLLLTLLKKGVYHRPQIDSSARFSCPEHRETALQAAAEGMVLLKNRDALLPLDRERGGTILVTGRMASGTETGGGGSSYVHTQRGTDFLTGLRNFDSRWNVEHLPWSEERAFNESDRVRIRKADIVLYCAGFNHIEESECWDRSWELPGRQGEEIGNIGLLNENLIVTLTAGGGVESSSWLGAVKGLIHTFYLGESAGPALASLLFGETNPSGRLPFTMAKNWADFASTSFYVSDPEKTSPGQVFTGQGNPMVRRMRTMEYGEGLNVGYRHFTTSRTQPQFPFGYGLSYTTFGCRSLKVSLPLKEDEYVTAVCQVENTGGREGAAVLQLYVHDAESRLYRPEKELKGFEKVFLKPGKSEKVSFSLKKRDFMYYDPEASDWVLEPGEFTIILGFSSGETACSADITLE